MFCAIFAHERALMLNTLRFAEGAGACGWTPSCRRRGGAAKSPRAEIAMARRLVEEMSKEWRPEALRTAIGAT